MRHPYENVFIGTFIFTLGFMFRERRREHNSSAAIELYQQTPSGEKTVGDLLTTLAGKSLIVEFKRDKNGISSELKKKSKKSLRDKLRVEYEEKLGHISRRCHFLAYGGDLQNGNKDLLEFLPYADLESGVRGVSDKVICERYLDQNTNDIGVDNDDFKYYVSVLSKLAGGTCGGLAISVGNNGINSVIYFDDVRDLSKTLSFIENKVERELQKKELSSGLSLG